MTKRLLDLFCKAGGAGVGYAEAGFEVVGVDIDPQKNYPFEFHQADALTFPLDGFDVVHASPVCKRWTTGAARWGRSENHPDQIGVMRDRLRAAGVPYVIENVPGAPLLDPITLCGVMFGLGVFRHRCFEIAGAVVTAPVHVEHDGRIGDGKYHTVAGHSGGSSKRDGWVGGVADEWRKAMDIGWMTRDELAQAIPPAYTEHIGRQILAQITPNSEA